MTTAIYLIVGLAVMGGLFYGLVQLTARQQRLNAELTRLERLSAEVSMTAGAMLEQVDMRIDYLNDLVAQVEQRLAAAAQPAAPAQPQPPTPTPAPAPVAGKAPTAPASIQRYQEVRAEVSALADQGLDAGQIAERTGVPRGEVQLILNLRSRRASA